MHIYELYHYCYYYVWSMNTASTPATMLSLSVINTTTTTRKVGAWEEGGREEG